MLDLDVVLRAAENPPFDRVRRLGVKLEGSLEDASILTLSATLRAGNGGPESAPKVIQTIRIRSRQGLDHVIAWVTQTTQAKKLAVPTIDESYAAADPTYHGPASQFRAVLDARLSLARALVAPQALIAIHPMHLGGEDGEPEGCVCWARFQGTLITPHVISVRLFDQDFTAEERALRPILEAWSINVAGINRVSLG